MLSRKKQLVAKIESVEGVAETLAAADGKLLAHEMGNLDFDPEMFEQNVSLVSLGSLGPIVGKVPGKLPFSLAMKGSGSKLIAAEWTKILRATGFKVTAYSALTIGAITAGPFQHHEIITGGTSNATGRVLKNTANGVTTLYFVIISGTFQTAEVITGGTSGATATTGSVPVATGNVAELLSDNDVIPSLTMAGNYDKVRMLLKGARGSLTVAGKNGQPVMQNYEFQGVYAGVTDAEFLTGIVNETTKPGPFKGAVIKLDGYALPLSEFTLAFNQELYGDDDPADAQGIKSFIVTNRNIMLTIDPKFTTVAAHDYYGKWMSGAEIELDISWGSTATGLFEIYGPKAQYTKVSLGERSLRNKVDCNVKLNDSVLFPDSAVCILMSY